MNLAGIVVPGERVAAVPGKAVRYRNGSSSAKTRSDSGEANNATTAPLAKRPRHASPVFPATLPEPTPPPATLF
jgi:hypothetical protein